MWIATHLDARDDVLRVEAPVVLNHHRHLQVDRVVDLNLLARATGCVAKAHHERTAKRLQARTIRFAHALHGRGASRALVDAARAREVRVRQADLAHSRAGAFFAALAAFCTSSLVSESELQAHVLTIALAVGGEELVGAGGDALAGADFARVAGLAGDDGAVAGGRLGARARSVVGVHGKGVGGARRQVGDGDAQRVERARRRGRAQR